VRQKRSAAAAERPVAAVPTARDVAAAVLVRVTREGAYAAAALNAELARYPQLDPRERSLATELVYGPLRTQGALLERLNELASRGVAGGDALVTVHLLVAAYQVLLLDRIPAFAAVDAAVTALRAARGSRVAGFANALLRRLAQGPRLDLTVAVWTSAPGWLRQRLEQAVSREEAFALLGAGSGGDPDRGLSGGERSVRLTRHAQVPDWLEAAPPGRVAPSARRVSRGGDLRGRPGWQSGAFVIQEEGSQVVAHAVGARPGERILDACAGHGQKASLLAEQVGETGELWVADLHPAKLDALASEFARLGLAPPHAAALDWTAGSGSVPGGFDRVLVDAPCTGVGTLRHRPEITLRLQPEDPARLGALAVRIVRRVATRLRPGGRLVFAVCSVLPEECERVVAEVGDLLQPEPFDAPLLAEGLAAGQASLRLLPLRHGTDGYFIASFRRPE